MYNTIASKIEYLSETKDLIRQSLVNKGQDVQVNTPFRQYANIISNMGDTSNLEPVVQQQNLLITNLYNEINTLQNIVDNKSVMYNWQAIGYNSAPTELDYFVNYSENVYNTWNNNKSSMYRAYYESPDIMFFPNVNTSNVNNMSQCFYNCYALVHVPQLNLSKVTNMYQTFARCQSVMDLPPLNTANATTFQETLRGCVGLRNLPQFNVTNSATRLDSLCIYCYNLLDASSCETWDVSNVTNTAKMFSLCYNLTNVPISNWSPNKITNIGGMFEKCNSLTDTDVTNIINFVLNCTSVTTKTLVNGNNAFSPFQSTNISNIRYENRWTELTEAGWTY